MYATGLRIGDAIRLPITAVDAEAMVLRVIGKGNKERIIPINDSLLQLLRETWKIHRSEHFLFVRPNGQMISESSFGLAIRVAREQCGFGKEFTAHVLRHSFATRLLEKGVPVETIQMLLGHAHPRSTQIYLHLTKPIQDGIRKQLDRFFSDCLQKGGSK
jgi:integrase/recombinase XerD